MDQCDFCAFCCLSFSVSGSPLQFLWIKKEKVHVGAYERLLVFHHTVLQTEILPQECSCVLWGCCGCGAGTAAAGEHDAERPRGVLRGGAVVAPAGQQPQPQRDQQGRSPQPGPQRGRQRHGVRGRGVLALEGRAAGLGCWGRGGEAGDNALAVVVRPPPPGNSHPASQRVPR